MHNLTKQLLDAVKNSNDENVDPFDLIKKYVKYHSDRNADDTIVRKFFHGHIGKFLILGANNGLDQSYQLLKNGWHGVYCEADPHACVELLKSTEKFKNQVKIINSLISTNNGLISFYSSADHSHLSSVIQGWGQTHNVQTRELISNALTPSDLFNLVGYDFDYVQTDLEGIDIELIESIDWGLLKQCQLICTEAGPAVLKKLCQQGNFLVTDITNTNCYYTKYLDV